MFLKKIILNFFISTGLLAGDISFCVASSGARELDMPAHFHAVNNGFDYTRRDIMIPMRDGVKLHTVILLPNNVHNAPILLTRTPYDADQMAHNQHSSHMDVALHGYDNMSDMIKEGGYIRVLQDVRGKYGSGGDYVMQKPLAAPKSGGTDESTDAYDTIDWLVKNLPQSNGRVGLLGISYDGFLVLMGLVHPHPALKAAVPMNAMVDGWRGDDWFHNGAFREQMLPYLYEQGATRDNSEIWWSSHYDDYDTYMNAVSAGALGNARGMQQIGFYKAVLAHPAYDSFWQAQAVDKIMARQPVHIPTMLVHSLWDQEDIYGTMATYYAMKPHDSQGDMLHLVIGPWFHGGEIRKGAQLGTIEFGSDTGVYFRQQILAPFLASALWGRSAQTPPVVAFVTGENRWESLPAWPLVNLDTPAKTADMIPAAFRPDHKLVFTNQAGPLNASVAYVSDPARPVPYRHRPILAMDGAGSTWHNWLVDDQREASGRTDVVAFVSEVLQAPLTVRGQPYAHLKAAISGTDVDFVVKVVDVYPDEVADQPELGGYQLMISADIFRGRYRNGLNKPEAVPANTPQMYGFYLPVANHTFLPGHRIMVQVQSSWFPLYDRNPQTFVDNIFLAQPEAYKAMTVQLYEDESRVDLPVVNRMGAHP